MADERQRSCGDQQDHQDDPHDVDDQEDDRQDRDDDADEHKEDPAGRQRREDEAAHGGHRGSGIDALSQKRLRKGVGEADGDAGDG